MQVLLKGQGKNFCAGIDFSALNSINNTINVPCPGRAREALRRHILKWQVCQHHSTCTGSLHRCYQSKLCAHACLHAGAKPLNAASMPYQYERALTSVHCMQDSITAIEKCRWPVIAVVQGERSCCQGEMPVLKALWALFDRSLPKLR